MSRFSHLSLNKELRINESEWRSLSDDELEELALIIFKNYRTRGYPYYRFTPEERYAEFRSLQGFNRSKLIQDGVVQQTMHGLSLAWSYFDHAWSIQCGKMRTPMAVFDDDNLFLKAIHRRLKRGAFITDAGIRKTLRSYTGTQSVSNFRPTAAAAIYDRYAGGGVVWDMSSGFGGRLLGALVSDKVKLYIGTEPSTKTYEGLLRMKQDLLPYVNADLFADTEKEVIIHCSGSEDFLPEPESLDLAFTSPPYFDTEKYADEPTQSFMKFPTKDEWSDGFLRQTFRNVFVGLKPCGYMILNIADVKTHKNVTDDVLRVAKEEGFILVDTLQLALSNIAQGGFKYEPVFVFTKP